MQRYLCVPNVKELTKFVDKNEEARLIRRFYYTPIRRRLEFM